MINQAEMEAKKRAQDETSQRTTQDLNRQVAAIRPMPVMGGVPSAPVNGIARPYLAEDETLLERSKPFRLRGEKLMQFFARTGVSAHQVLTLSKRDLDRLIAIKLANKDDVTEPKATPIPDKFRVTFEASGFLDAHLASRLPANIIEVGD